MDAAIIKTAKTTMINRFLETIKSLDDDTISLLQVIYQKINEKSENNVFSQELFELLQQNQMLV